jgi:hypothetical protein
MKERVYTRGVDDTSSGGLGATNTHSEATESPSGGAQACSATSASSGAKASPAVRTDTLDADQAWRADNNLLRPQEIDSLCATERSAGNSGVVAGLIGKRTVSFLIGDSGLGKSPLAYQLGLCVASGIPFFGMKTFQGTVVYADYENGLDQGRDLRERLVQFLELPKSPDDFLVWTPDHSHEGLINLDAICQAKPSLLIIDTVRSHSPHFERTEYAGEEMKQLNTLAHEYGVAILVIHRLRKPTENGAPSLDNDDTALMLWLKQAAGHSSIINQSDTRIAVDLPDGRKRLDAALVIRWHRRIKGESGPLYLDRVCDGDSGEPLGYRTLTDVRLLGNSDQEDAFLKLPAEFSFKHAREAYGRTDDPTRKWLQKCVSLGLVRQVVHGRYARTDTPQVPIEVSSGPQDR